MYIKVTTNSAGQTYYHLVESYWENGRSKQRTLLALGKAGDGTLERLITAISRHREVMGVLDIAKAIDVKDTFVFGPLLVLERIFSHFGLKAILDQIAEEHPRLGFDLYKVVFAEVACRFIRPGSKLKIFEHWQNKLYPGMMAGKIALHQLYRALDILARHKDQMETKLFWRDRDLWNREVDVVLYDLTTLRFESVREDLGKLRRFGYSKEMRTDCTQVVLGLLVDPEGMPLGFEVYPGNTFEGKTVGDIVQKMRLKFKVRRFIFIGDRGLFSQRNLQEIRLGFGQGEESRIEGQYIVGMRLKVLGKQYKGLYDLSGFEWIGEDLAVDETVHGEDRLIVIWSKIRAERDRQTREDILSKIREKLSQRTVNAKTFVTNRNYQKYLSGLTQGHRPKLNEQAIREEAAKDGFFGILTNVKDMSAAQVVHQYKNLWIIEDAFGELKGTLKARPVFHWTDKRIVGHLTMCFWAYLCEAQLTKALRHKGAELESPAIDQGAIDTRALTVVEAMKELCDVRAIPVKIRSKTIWVRTDIAGNAAKLFKAIGLKIPPKVLNLAELQNPAGTNLSCERKPA